MLYLYHAWKMYLKHARQRTKEAISLLPHHYTWVRILRILSITEGIRGGSIFYVQSYWWSRAVRVSLQTYDSRRRRDHEDIRGLSLPVSRYDWETRRFCVRPGRPVMESVAEPDDPELRDVVHVRAAFHRHDVESAAESDEPDTWDAAPYRAALYRSVVEASEVGDDLDSGEVDPYRAALHKPVVEAADDPDSGDTAPYRAVLHRPVVESAARRENLSFGDATPDRAALHGPIVGSTEGGDSLSPEEAAPYRAALNRPWTPDSDPVMEELLRDTPEPCTPPVVLQPQRDAALYRQHFTDLL